jgi:uncharacterized protein (TIGR02001 family)
MKNVKALTLGAAVASVLMSTTAVADLSGNIGVTNNYIWRGVTQTSDEAAVSGGLDYSHGSGAYAGAWVSNISPLNGESGQYELDLYAGYAGEAGDISYDVGVIKYVYPIDDGGTVLVQADFAELQASVGYGPVSFYVASTFYKEGNPPNDSDLYWSLSGDFEVGELGVGVVYGDYDFDGGSAGDYSHYALNLSKDDFTFAFEQNDTNTGDDMKFVVSWGKEFAL